MLEKGLLEKFFIKYVYKCLTYCTGAKWKLCENCVWNQFTRVCMTVTKIAALSCAGGLSVTNERLEEKMK